MNGSLSKSSYRCISKVN